MAGRRLVPAQSTPTWLCCFLATSTLVAGCRSSSTTVTGPTSSKCAIAVTSTGATVPSGGGGGTVGVSTNRECTWSASSQADWLAITGATSGQGAGTIAFTVAANPAPAPRRAGIVVGQQRLDVQQDAATCEFTIQPAAVSLPGAGGELRVNVSTLAGCGWTSQSAVPWATVTTGAAGNGPGSVSIEVLGNPGEPRSASLHIAGRTFSLSQEAAASPTCSYELTSSPESFGSAGGSGTVTVRTAPGCSWSVSNSAAWISLPDIIAGAGSGTVPFRVSANGGPGRNATLSAGGRSVSVLQEAAQQNGCSYSLSPLRHDTPAIGGNGEIRVSAGSECPWTATSHASWVIVTLGNAGEGEGRVLFTTAANPGAVRSGTLAIAGQDVMITQASAAPASCSFAVSPETLSPSAGGSSATVSVNTTPTCTWTATSSAPWIAVTGGASGAGAGSVWIEVAANPSAARSGTIVVAGRTVTVSQPAAPAASCNYVVSPVSVQVASAGGSFDVEVTTGPQCQWAAQAGATWLQLAGNARHVGPARVTIAASSNSSSQARTGSVTVAGRAVAVQQAPAPSCSFKVSPDHRNVPAKGGSAFVKVKAETGCAWTATSAASWVTITSGASGSGDGEVGFEVATNTSEVERVGTLVIAGESITVRQLGTTEKED